MAENSEEAGRRSPTLARDGPSRRHFLCPGSRAVKIPLLFAVHLESTLSFRQNRFIFSYPSLIALIPDLIAARVAECPAKKLRNHDTLKSRKCSREDRDPPPRKADRTAETGVNARNRDCSRDSQGATCFFSSSSSSSFSFSFANKAVLFSLARRTVSRVSLKSPVSFIFSI